MGGKEKKGESFSIKAKDKKVKEEKGIFMA